LVSVLYDRMTEQRYTEPIASYKLDVNSKPWKEIEVLERGTAALAEVSQEMGLAYDEQDLEYYTTLFRDVLKRNPTSVECFDLAQSNSEHSRHWFFKVFTHFIISFHLFFHVFFSCLNFDSPRFLVLFPM